MAAATPELKERFKELGIFNGTWSDGHESFEIGKGGNFNIHSLKITRFKESDGKWRKMVQYKPTRWHSKYGRGGGFANQFEYGTSLELFNEVWNQFMIGYKEYKQLKQENEIDKEFNY